MNNRLIFIQSYLFILGVGLLAMGLLAGLNYQLQDAPSLLTVLLLPDSALLAIFIGCLLLLVFQGDSRWRWLPGLLALGLCSYTLAHNFLAGGQDQGVSLISGFLRTRSLLAFCLWLTAAALLLPDGRWRSPLLQVVGGVLVLIALWQALVLWLGESWAFGWVGFKFSADLMAVLVLTMLGLALILLSSLPYRARMLLNPASLSIGGLSAVAAALIWFLLGQADIRNLMLQSSLVLDATEKQLDDTLQGRLALMQRMGERWEVLGRLPVEPVWRHESSSYLRDHPDIQFVALLDAQHNLVRLRQRHTSDQQLLRQLLNAQEGMDLWHRHDSPQNGHPRAFLAGQLGTRSLLVMPVDLHEDRFLLVASLELGQTLGNIFGSRAGLFDLQVKRAEHAIVGPVDAPGWIPVMQRSLVLEHDEVWHVQTLAARRGIADQGGHLNAGVFTFMLLLGLLLMVSQRFAGLTLERNRALQIMTHELRQSLDKQMQLAAFNQQVMRQSMDIICAVDDQNRFVHVSDSANKVLGYAPSDLEGRSIMELVLPEDHLATKEIGLALLQGQVTSDFRNRYRHRDGHTVHMMWSAAFDTDNRQLFAVGRDISQLVIQEIFAQHQLEVLGLISRQAPLVNILEQIIALAEQRLPGQKALIQHKIDIDATVSDWSRLLHSADGQVLGSFTLQSEQAVKPDPEQQEVMATCAQLAALAIEREQDRNELQESEQRYRSLFSSNPDAVFSLDTQGNFRAMNGPGVELTGMDSARLQQMHFRQVIHPEDLSAVDDAFQQAVGGLPQRYETRVVAGNKSIIDLDVSLLPIQVNGLVQGVFGIAKDLRAYKEARRALQRQLDFTRAITSSLQEGLLATDASGRIEFANPAVLQLLGQRELTDAACLQHWTPLDPGCWIETPVSGLNGEFVRQEGHRVRHLHYHATPLWQENAEPGWVIILRDITRERAAESAMRERDQFFRLSLEMFCMISLKGDFVQLNPSFLQVLGYGEQELLSQPYIELILPTDRAKAEAAINDLAQGIIIDNLDLQVRHSSGHYLVLEVGAALGDDRIIYVVARDVTEQRANERLLEQHSTLFGIAGEIARVGGWMADLASREVVLSDEICLIHRLPPGTRMTLDEIPGLYAPQWREQLRDHLESCLRDGTPYDLRCEALTSDGELLWVRLMGKAMRGQDGRVSHVQGALQDVTAEVRVEQEMQQMARRLHDILESIADAFFSLDHDWRFTYINRQAEAILQRGRDELLGGDIWQLFPEAVESPAYVRYHLALSSGEVQHFEIYYEPLFCWLEISAYPYEGGLSVFFRDIGERKASEQRLQLAVQELERSNYELQDFAFIASHDLQEPLRKVQAFGERLAQRSGTLDEAGLDYLQRMRQAAERMQALIRDLLTYSRVTTQGEPLTSVALDQVLDDVLQDLETVIEEAGATIDRQPLITVQGDSRQLSQMLQNLISNALKFHPREQTPLVQISGEENADGSWTLCIADNGIGFDEKYLDRIFNPFQRLHGRQQFAGNGIGLAVVRKIVQRHGGEITAQSQPGSGARFYVRFPAPFGATIPIINSERLPGNERT